jgi:hypothetical protein
MVFPHVGPGVLPTREAPSDRQRAPGPLPPVPLVASGQSHWCQAAGLSRPVGRCSPQRGPGCGRQSRSRVAYETSALFHKPFPYYTIRKRLSARLGHGQRNRMTHPLITLASLASLAPLARTAFSPTPTPAWHALIPEAPDPAPDGSQPDTSDQIQSNLIKADHTQSKSIETVSKPMEAPLAA